MRRNITSRKAQFPTIREKDFPAPVNSQPKKDVSQEDILQYEINPYLDPLSRIEWNKVLKHDERVYTKFPKDYAIWHQLQVSLIIYQKILYNINECYNSQYTPDLPERMHFLLYRYACFFLDCLKIAIEKINSISFLYQVNYEILI